jgi:pimeloyl-ACP methyl ester carboxylesterase
MTTSAVFTLADGRDLHVTDKGMGVAVIFQHGLGGNAGQVEDGFPADAPCRRITMECRGHGLSGAVADESYSIAGFADDILALADTLDLQRFIIGGISMGAAIALRLAVKHADRISGLILARPAWLTASAPDNMKAYGEVARLLRAHGGNGRAVFAQSPTGQRLQELGPDNLASLLGFFERDNPEIYADLFEAIAKDGPGVTEAELHALQVPTLVVGHSHDMVHPLDYARRMAAMIPGAHLAEITPKAVDKARYSTELHAAIGAFLKQIITSKPEETRA